MRARDWLRHNRPDLNVGTRGPLKDDALWELNQAYLDGVLPDGIVPYCQDRRTARDRFLTELDSNTAVE